ncbi:MAG: class I SAM-dependent methyltransferase [Patescibacteria group bacterium]
MSVKCIICDGESESFIRHDGYNFLECSGCKLLFVSPMPSDEELSIVYSPKVGYQSNKTKNDYTKTENYKYKKILEEVLRQNSPNKNVLDVGASDGEFLFYAKKAGFTVAGVEPNQTTADIGNSRGLNVYCGFLNQSSFAKNFFGILRLGDVLEHSNNPDKLIQECSEYLVSGGLLVVSIPNMDSNWARSTRFFTNFWRLPWSVLTPPHHLFYFSKNNLDMFFKKKGFTLVTAWYHRPPTLKYELGNTHLFGEWKRNKGFRNTIRFVWGFALYSALYCFDFLITPFKQKDFGMLCIYRKDA